METIGHKILNRYPLGNPHRLWKQDNFILSTFAAHASNMRDCVENLADCGFNLLELGWASHEHAQEALRICEERNIKLLYQDFSVFGGMQERNLERKIGAETAKAVSDMLRPWKCVMGTYNWDEPYVLDQLKEARRQMDMFQRELPDRLPFTVAIPSYNTKYRWDNKEFAPYLERYVNEIDPPVLSLDFYPIGLQGYTAEKQLDNSLMWCDLGEMRRLGRKYDIPLWFYYQGLPMCGYEAFTFPMVRMMMYSAAMYGVKGLQQYTCCGSVIDEDGAKYRFFEEQKQIHAEFAKLGNTLMALKNDFVFHSDDLLNGCPTYAPYTDSISDSAVLTGALPARTSVGELSDDYGNKYLLIVNRDFEKEATPVLNFKNPSRLYAVSRETGRQLPETENVLKFGLSLKPGDAYLYRVQPMTEEAYTVEYRIEK